MGISAKDLARHLGISAAAVSMALNDKPGVSEATRKQVIEAAKELGYDMRNISKKDRFRGRIIFLIYKKHGAVVGETLFFSDLTEAIIRSCRENRYTPELRYVLETDSVESELRAIVSSGADGLILLGTEMRAEDFQPFQDLPIPLVVLDTYFEELDKDCVLINNVQGAYLATRYLISKHRGQPGYLRSSYPIGNFEERADGFYKAIRESGLSTSRSVVHYLAPSSEGAYADMKALLAAGEKTAPCYFADNDLIAAGAIRAFKGAGYRIPEDVGFVGFDNTALCEMIEPPLTTINVPRQSMGRVAVERLIALMSSGNVEQIKVEIRTTLVKRRSL